MFEIRREEHTRDAYNKIYREEEFIHRDSFYLWLISLLKPVPGRLLVDISCGSGRLVTLAGKHQLRSIGVDFAMEGVLQGHNQSPERGWVVGDGEKVPFADQSVDYVTNIGSLEHYLDPIEGAKQIARILKPDGKACILLPNAFGMLGNIKYAWEHGEIYDDGQPLQRYATRQTWEKMLKEAGLRILTVVGYDEVDLPRTLPDLLWLIKRPQKIIRKGIASLCPLNLANHFVFICTRG